MSFTKTAKLEQTIQCIKERYALGQWFFQKCQSDPSCHTLKQMAASAALCHNTAQKLRALANPQTGFTETELEALFCKFRKVGRALTVSHLIRLLSLPKGPDRTAMLDLALVHNWGANYLQREINTRRVRVNARKAGRRPRVSTGRGFEADLLQTMQSWNRLLHLQLAETAEIDRNLQLSIQKLKMQLNRTIELFAQSLPVE